jgi:hypothetical protein
MAEPPRRFPSPWHADPMPGGYVVRDANGQSLAYLYSRDNEDEARQAKVLTKDEARVNVARLPELLKKAERDQTPRIVHEGRYGRSLRAAELPEARASMPRLAWCESALPQ